MHDTRIRTRSATALVIGLGLATVPNPLLADDLEDIKYYELVARLGADVPNGSGVTVGQVEASSGGSYAPDVSNPNFAGVNFNLRSGASGISNHATSVANSFYGSAASVAFGVTNVQLYEANNWLGSGYLNYNTGIPSAPPEDLKIFNHSWIAANTGVDANLVRRADYAAHSYNLLFVVGVNGVGKTTTIGKLASRLKGEGKSVMLAAGDTFRAAAVEQLQVWGERNQVPVIAQHTGADSASVVFDGIQAAKSRGADIIIADTAGRLHNKSNLMEELKKVKRVAGKLDDKAPHEILLVLDAGTGQNAVSQMAEFDQVVGITGIALTKLDGTAKGGVIFSLADKFSVPIRYIGVGEELDDLRPFNAKEFVNALLQIDK